MIKINNTFVILSLVMGSLLMFASLQQFFLAAVSNTSVNVLTFTPSCSSNVQCGTDGLTGGLFCQTNNVYQDYTTYTCNDAGLSLASCSSAITTQLQTMCVAGQTCTNGSCVVAQVNQPAMGYGGKYYPVVITPLTYLQEQEIPLPPTPSAQSQSLPASLANKNTPAAFLSYLPAGITDLSLKIPELNDIFEHLNIISTAQAADLKNYTIFSPGLQQIIGAGDAIPEDVLFVLLGNKNIDALSKLNFSSDDISLQTINVLPSESMHLVVKPASPAKQVSGEFLFTPENLLGANQKFSVFEFNYTPTKDGVYIADIPSPSVEGHYQIITSIKHFDEKLADKNLAITTLVDPDGYIYENIAGKELRISNAIVSLYKLNSRNQYELWQAKQYGQENPQITDSTGKYSFLVPEGTYYVAVSALGYSSYQGIPVSVKEGKEINANIALKKQLTVSSFIDWNTILIIILFCLVAYNFYQDWRKNKVIL